MDPEAVKRARIFLGDNRLRYKALCDDIRAACESVARTRPGIVRRIYGRDEKQEGTRLSEVALKAPAKVAKKWSEDYRGQGSFAQIPDIAGLTIVVYYADQIDGVLAAVIAKLAEARIVAGEPRVKKTDGYFATHVVFTSNNIRNVDLKCELQVKTMLHEAWSSKTHDLTNKPRVRNDDRLSRMMNAIAETLQAIEVQSETVRDLIHERWNADQAWRDALQSYSFKSLPNWVSMDGYGVEAKELRNLIEANEGHLRTAPDSDPAYQRIAVRVHRLCENVVREGYILRAYLAVVRGQEAEREAAIESALQWLSVADGELREGRAKSYEVWSIPLVLQACGDLAAAIWAGHQLRGGFPSLSEREQKIVSFNLANHLVEDSYFAFPARASELTGRAGDSFQAAKRAIEKLMDIAAPLRAEDETAFLDLDGMFAVVFSEKAKEIEAGIEKITAGNTNVPDDAREAASAYYNLHIRMAWRRLLELETSEPAFKSKGEGE